MTLLDDRRTYLLEQAGEALEDGRVPLSEWFIHEHDVTLDEAHDLADDMASAIDLYLLMREQLSERVNVRAKRQPQRPMPLRACRPPAIGEG